jgi:hypothetical protein
MTNLTAIAEAARRVVEAEKLVSERYDVAKAAAGTDGRGAAMRALVTAENECSDADEALKSLTPASVVLEMAEALAWRPIETLPADGEYALVSHPYWGGYMGVKYHTEEEKAKSLRAWTNGPSVWCRPPLPTKEPS